MNGAGEKALDLQEAVDEELLRGIWTEEWLKISELGGMIRFCSGRISLTIDTRADQ